MGRTRTIAKQILDEARRRVIIAEADVNAAVIELEKMQAVLGACRIGYAALEKSLAPQPRRATTKSNGGMARATKDSLSRAAKKSSPKKRAGLPTSSSEDLMDRRPAPDEMCAYISDDGRGNGRVPLCSG